MVYDSRARDLDNKWTTALLCLLFGDTVSTTGGATAYLERNFMSNWLEVLQKSADDLMASDHVGNCHTCKRHMTKKDCLDTWAWMDALWKEPEGASIFTRVILQADATQTHNTCVECLQNARILVAMKCDS